MKSFNYSIPETLLKHKELVEVKCDILIEAFNQLCKEEDKRIQEEKRTRLANRVFNYLVREIEDGWLILYKEATPETAVGDTNNSDTGWSVPFKIINGVLIHRNQAHNSKMYMTATALIPQGLFDKDLNEINRDW